MVMIARNERDNIQPCFDPLAPPARVAGEPAGAGIVAAAETVSVMCARLRAPGCAGAGWSACGLGWPDRRGT